MSAPRIIAQAAPSVLVSSPGVKLPTKLSLKATISGGAGAPTVVSVVANNVEASSLGVSISTADSGLTYDVTFPAGKQLDVGSINVNVLPNVVATTSERRHVAIDKTAANTNGGTAGAQLGRFRFNVSTLGGTLTAPVAGSEIHANWWVDYS
jgi:hypothetical protein